MAGFAVASGILGAAQAAGNIAKGKAEKTMYDKEAKRAELQADMDTMGRNRELNDALAMQAVMFGAQGRQTGVGSTEAIMQEDRRRAEEDIGFIKSGAKVKSSGARAAGRIAERKGITAGLIGGSKSLLSMEKAGAFSGGE